MKRVCWSECVVLVLVARAYRTQIKVLPRCLIVQVRLHNSLLCGFVMKCLI